MGTSGVYGFRKNGKDKVTYNHYDSYPSGLGKAVAEFCIETPIDEMNAIYDRIELVSNDDTPSPGQIEDCKPFTNVHVGDQGWYSLLRDAQGDLNIYRSDFKYMLDNADYIKDSSMCEYGYIINLDDKTLEFWVGYQNEPQEGNRYGTETIDGYYPCKLVEAYPLDEVTDLELIIDAIKEADLR